MRGLLFPEKPRSFAGERACKIIARAVHVLCVAGFVGGNLHDATPEQLRPWLIATIGSGMTVLLLDLYQSAAFLLQVRGLVLFAKLSMLGSALLWPTAAVPLLVSMVLLSVISSHAPSKIRYALVFGRGRVAASKRAG